MCPHVVVLGAGYAGVSAATRLARGGMRVTVVNPRAVFVERIRLHQRLVGNHPATVPLERLLPRTVAVVTDTAVEIDRDRCRVRLAGGGSVAFDYLVYALGSRDDVDVVAGAAEHAVTVGDLDTVVAAHRRLTRLPLSASVTVVGGGLTGVEVAAELAEAHGRDVRLVSSGPVAAGLSTPGRDYVRWRLAALGVEVVEHRAATEIGHRSVTLSDGCVVDSDLTVLTARVAPPPLARDSGLDVDGDGALRVRQCLTSTSAEHIVGAGDAASLSTPVRRSCQAAVPLGAHAAETVLRLVHGSTPAPVRPLFLGQCLSLGRRAGLWQRTTRDDVPTRRIITARPAAWIKEQVCAGTVKYALHPRWSRLASSWSFPRPRQ